jgi:hypothetical protein
VSKESFCLGKQKCSRSRAVIGKGKPAGPVRPFSLKMNFLMKKQLLKLLFHKKNIFFLLKDAAGGW